MNETTLPSSRDILVVDDDIHVVKSLKRMLRPFCGHIFTAISGEQALAILQRHTVAAIVADMLCPPISGIDVFRTAKLTHAATFTLMLSGKSDTRDIRRAMRDGIVDGFLFKPWDNEDVIAALHDSLAHYHAACYDNCCSKKNVTSISLECSATGHEGRHHPVASLKTGSVILTIGSADSLSLSAESDTGT